MFTEKNKEHEVPPLTNFSIVASWVSWTLGSHQGLLSISAAGSIQSVSGRALEFGQVGISIALG